MTADIIAFPAAPQGAKFRPGAPVYVDGRCGFYMQPGMNGTCSVLMTSGAVRVCRENRLRAAEGLT